MNNRQRQFITTLTVFFGCVTMGAHAQAATWPASNSGTDISTALMAADAGFEPSGIAWSDALQEYIAVGDDGQVALLSSSGELVNEWDIGGAYDLEDVVFMNGTDDRVYLLDENTSAVREFSLTTGTLTGTYWDCSAAESVTLSEIDGAGVEGLAWVPDDYHSFGETPSGGAWYIGWQYDGNIYAFAADLSTTGSGSYLGSIAGTYTDISGLYFGTNTQRLYVVYDGANVLEERAADGTLQETYTDVPGSNQEGVTLVATTDTTANILFAEDSGRIMAYSDYPVTVIVEEEPEDTPEETPEEDPIAEPVEDPTEEPTEDPEEDLTEDPVDAPVDPSTPRTISAVYGRKHGNIRVEYSDESVEIHTIFSSHLRVQVAVRQISGTYALVRNSERIAIVNLRTGHVLSRHDLFLHKQKKNRWVLRYTGIDL